MDLRTILEKFRNGQLSIEQVQKEISIHSIEFASENLAQLDVGREVRKGIPEVIYAEGKKCSDVIRIASAVLRRKGSVVISRVPRADLSKVTSCLKKRRLNVEVGKNSTTVLVTTKQYTTTENELKIGIVSAGTSDISIAEEARLIAKAMGCSAIVSHDVG
jgi:pyridinium-3,5-biscarboxylic acid mononucleotide synthase